MARLIRVFVFAILLVAGLLGFTAVHELGHTAAARALGDPSSTFYFVKIDENGSCLGCNITDHTLLTPGENLVVHLAGLLATQLAGLALIAFSAWQSVGVAWRKWLRRIGAAVILLDVVVQGVQGLLYDVSRQTWPTGVDLVDVMLLVQDLTGLNQVQLKVGLVVVLALYLTAVLLTVRRARRPSSSPNMLTY